MSERTKFLRSFEEVYRLYEIMTQILLENPSCLEDLPEKKEGYNIATEYFKRKYERTKSEEEDDYNRAYVIEFEIMLENYAYASYKLKNEHAKHISLYIIQASESLLKTIPQDLKDEAFEIIFRYLEQQSDS